MYEAKLKVMNETGLHARPASDLMALSSTFQSDICILTENARINPKSIISILGGGVYKGTEITLQIEGEYSKGAFEIRRGDGDKGSDGQL